MSTDQPKTDEVALPVRLGICPIMEAGFELRFTTQEPWATLPGLLSVHVRARYPEQDALPLAQVPEIVRLSDPALTHLPLHRFRNAEFVVQLGPRVVTLSPRVWTYPGWERIAEEMRWLVAALSNAGVVLEVEHLALGYLNFIDRDVFRGTALKLDMGPTTEPFEQIEIAVVLRDEPFQVRISAIQSVVVTGVEGTPLTGSLLGINAWLGPLSFNSLADAPTHFDAAHALVKQRFFDLLLPEFLESLEPEYS